MKPKDHGSVAGLKRVHRLHKKQTAADFPSALARVKTLYEDAIEFSAAGQGTQGLLLSIYVIGAAMCAIFVWLLIESIGRQPAFSWVDGLAALMAAAIVNSASYWGIVLVRNEFYAPEDEPIIFDRSHRKIYRMYRDVRLGWSGIFRPWPIRITIHDWSLVDVEHHATPQQPAARLDAPPYAAVSGARSEEKHLCRFFHDGQRRVCRRNNVACAMGVHPSIHGV